MFAKPFVEKNSLADLQPVVVTLAGPEAPKRVRIDFTTLYSVNPNRAGRGDATPGSPHSHASPAPPLSALSATPDSQRTTPTRLAGLPGPVVERAAALLVELEKRPRAAGPTRQLSLFGARPAPSSPAQAPAETASDLSKLHQEWASKDLIRKKIQEINPDELTPRQAMDALYGLRALLGGAG